MKRLFAVLLLAAGSLLSQHGAPAAEHKGEAQGSATAHDGGHESGPLTSTGLSSTDLWKMANFLLLAGILGYFISKNAGPFFRARSEQIQKDIIEAGKLRADAEARMAAIQASLANLGTEVSRLRETASAEQQAEAGRLRMETQAEIQKVQNHAEQEIGSAGKAARLELKRYAAGLAIQLAQQKIQGRLNPAMQDELAQAFVRQLSQPAASETSTR